LGGIAVALPTKKENTMSRVLVFAYGLVAYGAFFAAILYSIGFLSGYVVPKGIDSGPEGPIGPAVAINVLLLGLFAVQHTIMARPRFKAWLGRLIPKAAERSTFVLAASLLLGLAMWQWRPLPGVIWHVEQPVFRALLLGLSMFGWGLVFYASFLIDHFDLFGLRQVFLHLRSRPYRHPPFMVRSVYRVVRHPLMLGFLIAFWATPTMTQGHLLFAVVLTAYILIGIRFEERDLVRHLGEDYQRYRRQTPMLLPLGKKKLPEAEPGEGGLRPTGGAK
jgi:protein-S-isoprenylcysteine O-methyltransferase Ste14